MPLRSRSTILLVLAVTVMVLSAAFPIAVRPLLAQTSTTSTCPTGTAVSDAVNNPGLVSDCEAPLVAGATLAGTAALQGTAPTATVIPTGTSPPPTPAPAVSSEPPDADDDEAQAGGLFSEVQGDQPLNADVETIASRLVGIDFGQLDQVTDPSIEPKDPASGKPTTPQTLVLNLFDDVVFTGIVEHVEPTASGHAFWGSLKGVELGTMSLVVNGEIVVGTVRTPSEVYTIRTAGDGKYVIRQIDESSLPPPAEPLEVPPSSPGIRPKTDDGADPLDDGSVIDVMVVYTPLAKHRHGGRAGIEALIDLFVTETNQAFANSGVTHRIRLVLREEVDYVEDGSSALGRLRNDSDGSMDHIHELRDVYAADLVHLVVGRTGGFYCGIAASVGGDESYGFAITGSSCGGITFAHELGHNMGLHHDRYVVGVPLTGSHYGYVNQRAFEPDAPGSSRWRTIMAYNDQCAEDDAVIGCPRVSYFSNPEKTYKGDPMGVPVDHPSTGVDGPADAVGTLDNRREITANFRLSSVSPTPRVGLTLSPYWLSENGGVSTVTASLHRPSSADTIVTVSVSPPDAVTLSANRTLTIPADRTESVGDTVTITGVDNGDQTGDVIVTVSATAENPSSLGTIAPEPVELAIADDETTPVVTLSLSPTEVFEGGDFRERRTLVTTSLDNRSSAVTTVTVSVSPAEAVDELGRDTLTIPAGQLAGERWTWLFALDDTEYTEAKKTVTVSGAATNPQGVTGPESVTLTIIDDDAPIFADDSISHTFTAGVAASRVLPEAEYGNEPLTYSLSPATSKGVTFAPGPPARIGVSETSVAAGETSYTLTATDAEGDTGTMTVTITVREGVCPNSAAVSGYSDPEIVRDCESLLISKHVLGGEQILNWDEDLSMGEWQGVSIADNRVVEVDTFNLGLAGSISSELGSLTNLQELHLGWNELTGPIPPELGDLHKLKTLRLDQNQLTGPIPSELGKLSQLSGLNLSHNELSGEIPVWLGDLSNLQYLDLGWNQLTGDIPAELSGLDKLQRLRLDLNPLSSGKIPVWLSGLSNLQTLSLRSIQSTGAIPPEIGDLGKLHKLDLAGNQLTGPIPSELGNLSQLLQLSLGHNELSGEVPGWLNRLDNLRGLNLGDNQLTGEIPVELSDLPHLIGLLLDGNQLTGEVPGWLNELDNLRVLELGDNQLTGEIPGTLGDLTELQWLNLGGNKLTGPIPIVLGSLAKLEHLRLHNNQLTGEIPIELGALTNLQWLFLNDNLLTGQIPLELGKLANLTVLYLGGNDFTGCMPEGLLDVVFNDLHLYVLPFCDDEIEQSSCETGVAVPDAANNPGLVSDCEALLAARDVLAGDATLNWSADVPIADWDGITLEGTPQRVIRLSFYRRGLSGVIPAELGSLAKLQFLYLDDNQLTGEIPPELGDLANLKRLGVTDNRFTGSLPQILTNLTSLEHMRFLSNAGLCAPIDDAFQTWLESIDTVWGSSCAPTDSLEDRAVLVELYNALDGENWTNNSNWLSDRPIREWKDVTNDADGRVNGLYLTNNNLSGDIPAALANLANLEEVYLTGNQLTGEIPAELGSLANLEVLYLVGNQLTGEIPAELGALAKLELMSLWGNQLTGEIPTELSSLANLEGLYLYNNRLTGGIPVELAGLSELRGLYLHNNQLTGQIPTELGDITNLQWLNLSQNQLTGTIPEELGNLTNLERLYLNDNQLNGQIPSQLGSLSNLERLYLGGNQLTGCVPAGLRDVPRNDFVQLNLPFCESDCETGVAVSDAANNPGLVSDCEALLASRDTLAGTATLNWSADTPIADWDGITLDGTPQRVTRLALPRRELTGEIPPELGDLENLQWLQISHNELTREIPGELGNLTNLERLYLHVNRLTGEIPPELGNLVNLEFMGLHFNELTGEVPPDVGNLSKLRTLLLDNNQLTGMLPQTMTELTLLRTFYFLDNAGLCAPADQAFQTWLQNVEGFRGSTCGSVDSDEDRPVLEAIYNATNGPNWEHNDNWLSEQPISEWYGVTVDVDGRVNGLYLSRNDLAGEVPEEIGSLSSLKRLYLSSNDLTGEIPEELRSLTNLQRLLLSSNQLTGPIPVWLSDLTNLKWVILGNNGLDGTIPAGIGNLTDLQFLYLDRNGLTGEIPTELGGLGNLERLWLHNNLLTGPIPEEFGNLAKLEQLNLGDNQLTGEIPSELGNLSNLDRLYLSGNLFSGCLPSALLSLEDTIENDFNSIGLPHECAVLLADRDTLAGTATLNWSADTPVAEWDGVKLGETPNRVTRIVLHNEGLNGTVPVSLGRLTRLIDLDLSNNELTGEIPGELGDLYFLRVLNLRTNRLTGPIPDDLGRLRNLRVLNLHSNNLSGGIPDLSGITGLVELYLPNNADYDVDGDKVEGTGLTGGIPAWLNGMTNMRELWLWGNSLSGSVPDLSGMTSLQKLKLANNDLDGGVPQASILPPNMTWLIIDRNPFGGTIPDMSSLSRLRLLWLHSNELEGMIPAGDMFPTSLDDLNLRDNMLMGTIPDLSNLDMLTRLRLHNNSLSGEVPATLGGLDSLKYLWLHNEDATKTDNGNNAFTSIAAGVGDLADTLIVIALNGNPWNANACVPAALANVARNDYAEAGIAVCSAGDGNGNGN